jgi:hypothetical protein
MAATSNHDLPDELDGMLPYGDVLPRWLEALGLGTLPLSRRS